jgi:hypothetical protein
MDEATKHRNRHRAIAELAKVAVVNLAELQAWLDAHGHGDDLPLTGYVYPAASWLWFHDLSQKAGAAWATQVEPSKVPALLREYELAADPEDLAAARKSAGVAYLSRDLQDRKLLAALHTAKLDRLLLGAAYDGDLTLYSQYGKNRQPIDFAEAKAEYATSPDASSKIERIDYWALRQPAPLFGEGFSDEMRQTTRLTRHLQLDTWTPVAAALLVCGIDAPSNCNEIPSGAFDLTGAWQTGSWDAFHAARRVLEIWNSQMSPPEKVRPAEFVAWCRSKGINTDWLREVPRAQAAPVLNTIPERHLTLVDSSAGAARPLQRRPAQDAAILSCIEQMGYDAMNLPSEKNGVAGVRSKIKAELERTAPDMFVPGSQVFKHAWNRLSSSESIAYK